MAEPALRRPRPGRLAGAVDRAREGALVGLQRYLDTHSEQLLGGLRDRRPILSLGRMVFVTRHEDVVAVLRDTTGTFASPYRARLQRPFVLVQDGAEHARSRAEIRAVLEPEDLALVAELTARSAQRRVDNAVRGGALDAGTDLVHPVLHSVVAEYAGLCGVSASVLLAWARDIFQDLFLDVPGLPPTVRRRAERAGAEMDACLDGLLAARRADPGDDLLSRMLLRQRAAPETAFDDAAIKDNLTGIAIPWIWQSSKAALLAVDGLVDRPTALAQARDAAERGDGEGVRRVLWEVLRHRPVQPGLLRICRRPTTLAAGTPRQTRIRRGTVVFASTQSAMWDETAVPDPGRFDPTRPEEQYLNFGDGPHRCLGEQLMRVQLPALLMPLLTSGPIRRSGGRAGRLRWCGPHPEGLRVDLGAGDDLVAGGDEPRR
jgi:cytochrome P450